MSDVIILTGNRYVPEWYPRIERTLGAYRVASALRCEGYSVTVIDYIQFMTVAEIISAISKHITANTLWVGYSSTFFTSNTFGLNDETGRPTYIPDLQRLYHSNPYESITKIYDYVRNVSKAKIVFGGAMALNKHADPEVDYYVAGYADVAVVELTNHIAGKGELQHAVENKVDGKVSYSIDSAKYPEPCLDTLTTDWSQEKLLPGEALPIEVARGCIFKCKFCSYPLLGKKKGTYVRNMDHIRDELIQAYNNGVVNFYITDDTFNDDTDKLKDFHQMVQTLPFRPRFSAFLRVDLIHRFPEQADLLLESGLIGAFFGVETFNWKSAKAIGKGLHPDKIKKTLSWLVKDKWKGKVNVNVAHILGLPYDDINYFKELVQYISSDEYAADSSVFFPLRLVDKKRGGSMYGSEFSLNPEVYGYEFDSDGKWFNKEQNLNYQMCEDIANQLSNAILSKQKISDFRMMQYLNVGVKLEHLQQHNMTTLHQMYDVPLLNNKLLSHYKKMVGAC